MLSINTNISSIVAQRSMTTSTTKLNQAIERLSTGSKINHAADNAANYSIAKNMSTQLSACDVAADNIAMGMDLLSVAQDTIAGMQDRGSRIHALITQARNGTYGADSLAAMTQEANALVSEINRLYINTEYNGIKLFDNIQLPEWAQEVKNTAGKVDGKSLEELALSHNGFIAEVIEETPDVTVTDPTQLADAISSNTKIGIGNAETLAKLAELVNSGTTCEGKTIILTEDIDLSAYQEGEGWTPIGDFTHKFQGDFNGNGHKVTGLYINRPTADYQGLFGCSTCIIKNIGVEGHVIGKDRVGLLMGYSYDDVVNCYAEGNVVGNNNVGWLVGYHAWHDCCGCKNCYTTCDVRGNNYIGGLSGYSTQSIYDCFTSSTIKGNDYVGGLTGYLDGISSSTRVENCYSTGNISGNNKIGGICGEASMMTTVTYCYTKGDIQGENDYVGGIIGKTDYDTGRCYSCGNISGGDYVGGIIGKGFTYSSINDMFVIGNIEGTGLNVNDVGCSGIFTNCEVFKYNTTSLQVGIHSDEDSKINVDTNLKLDFSITSLTSDNAYNSITNFLNKLSEKSTELGAAQNRLESAHESNMVQMDNLTSSLSTIRDADISEVSSDFIRQQILQQACATLMSTANQSPSIALQLI